MSRVARPLAAGALVGLLGAAFAAPVPPVVACAAAAAAWCPALYLGREAER